MKIFLVIVTRISLDKTVVKGKGHMPDTAPLSEGTSQQKRSGMARIVEGFHSFTCTFTRLSTNRMNHICLCLPSRSWSPYPVGMEGWVGLGTIVVSEPTATWRLSQFIVVSWNSCSSCYASLGNWSTAERWTHDPTRVKKCWRAHMLTIFESVPWCSASLTTVAVDMRIDLHAASRTAEPSQSIAPVGTTFSSLA